jgi:hypothetical protein
MDGDVARNLDVIFADVAPTGGAGAGVPVSIFTGYPVDSALTGGVGTGIPYLLEGVPIPLSDFPTDASVTAALAVGDEVPSTEELERFNAVLKYLARADMGKGVITGTSRDMFYGTKGTPEQQACVRRFFHWFNKRHPRVYLEVITALEEARREAANFLKNPTIRANMPVFGLNPEAVYALLQFGGSSGFGFIPEMTLPDGTHHPEHFVTFDFGYLKNFERTPEQEARIASFLVELEKRGIECLVNNAIGNDFEGNITAADGKTTIRTDPRPTRRLGPDAKSIKPLVASINALLAPHPDLVLTLINRVFYPYGTDEYRESIAMELKDETLIEKAIAKLIKNGRILLDASHGNEAALKARAYIIELSSGQCTSHYPDGGRYDVPGISGDGILAILFPGETIA